MPLSDRRAVVVGGPRAIASVCEQFEQLGCAAVACQSISRSLALVDTDVVVQVIEPLCRANPFELHQALGKVGYRGVLHVAGNMDARLLHGVALHAEQCGLNVCREPLVLPCESQALMTQCEALPATPASDTIMTTPPPRYRDLAAAIQAGHIKPWYQPLIRASDMRMTRVEVLARWIDANGQTRFPPAQFIVMAEACGLIDDILQSMIQQALTDLAPMIHQRHLSGMSINLSMANLHRANLADTLCEIVARHGLTPEQLTLEITENAVHAAEPAMLACLTRLRLAGFPVAIDDFGTGLSGLSQLRKIPFTELKIDRSFTQHIHLNGVHDAICRGAISMANDLGMNVVAEGIEVCEEGDRMREMGVTDLQGFYYARPAPIASLYPRSNEHRAVPANIVERL